MKIRKKLILASVMILLLYGLLLTVFSGLLDGQPAGKSQHTLTTEYIWYCLPAEGHDQPRPTEKAAGFIVNYPVYYAGNPDEKALYLTFDDPAENDKITNILDILKKHNVHAAFFMTEGYIRKNPDVIKRMVAEGNIVCNHTASHCRISKYFDYKKFCTEIEGVENAYRDATGQELPKFFRPPQGRFSELTLKYLDLKGYATIFWSYCYVDWERGNQPSTQKSIKAILDNTHNGEVILLHTQSDTNNRILDNLITKWTEMGYSFKSLYDLTGRLAPS